MAGDVAAEVEWVSVWARVEQHHTNLFFQVIYHRGHIAIYLGNDQIIDPYFHVGVTIVNMWDRGTPIGAARPFV